MFVKMLLLLISFCLVISCHGCFGDRVYGPEKVSGLPNTFRPYTNPFSFLHPKPVNGDKVLQVTVYGQKKTLWIIKATRDIPTQDFKVTAGKVPEGFEQLIPKPLEKFLPVPGEQYAIDILTNFISDPNTRSPHIVPTPWTAEPSN
jgi:hypothetical protein